MSKLPIRIPYEIIEYSHRWIDIDNHMNRESVSHLLYIKSKYDYVKQFFDIKVIWEEPFISKEKAARMAKWELLNPTDTWDIDTLSDEELSDTGIYTWEKYKEAQENK